MTHPYGFWLKPSSSKGNPFSDIHDSETIFLGAEYLESVEGNGGGRGDLNEEIEDRGVEVDIAR